jgi:hypothetical protein
MIPAVWMQVSVGVRLSAALQVQVRLSASAALQVRVRLWVERVWL